jgi:UDP-glucose 4-epimerase
MATILVTGGAGYIGTQLVKTLLTQGHHVTVISRHCTTELIEHTSYQDNKIKYIQTDLAVALQTSKIKLCTFDTLFHLAASSSVPKSVEDPREDFQKNVETTLILLEALRQTTCRPKVIFASSGAVYGNPVMMPIRETSSTEPISPYGVSKLTCERYITTYSRLYGISAASLRLFSIYGPGQKKMVVYDILSKLHQNPDQLEIIGDGSQSRDFVYIDDVVRAMILIAEKGALHGEVYNVASGQSTTIAQLISLICRVAGCSPQLQFSKTTRLGDPERWSVDISRLCELGYEPKYTLTEGLYQTYSWFTTHTT